MGVAMTTHFGQNRLKSLLVLSPKIGDGFSVYCGQRVGWINIKLDMEVSLILRHIVLGGTQLPLPKGAQPPIFGPCLLWPNGWMNQDATWYRGRPQPK